MRREKLQSNWFKGCVTSIVLITFGIQVSGCQNLVKNKTVQDQFDALSDILKDENATQALRWSQRLQAAVDRATDAANSLPALTGKASLDPTQATAFIQANEKKIEGYLARVEKETAPLRETIYEISRDTYENPDHTDRARDEALLYYALQFQRNIHRSIVQASAPMMIFAGADALKNVKAVQDFKKAVTTYFFRNFGAQIVSQNDLKRTLDWITEMNQDHEVPQAILANINSSRAEVESQYAAQSQSMKQTLTKIGAEGQAKLKKAIQEFVGGMSEASFLYNPDQNFGPVANLLIVIGNLTWGLVNTLIGAGIVLWAMGLSAFGLIDFPTFAIAANGHMIYADVTGANPLGIGGKLSMGLFELDNGAGYEYASGHEGVHGLQSALFGPLYLPTVVFTYVLSGFDQGFMEQWADAWAYM